MNNILVVNINWLGDAVFSTPVFKALKATYPQARLSCLCVPRVRDVLQHCPYVDKIIVYDEKGRHRMPWAKGRLIRKLTKEKFDAAFLLHRSMTRSLMVYLAGIPLRIGFGKAAFFLTHPVPMDAEDIHRCDYYLKVLEFYGIKVKDRVCELRLTLTDMQKVEHKLKNAGIGPKEDYVVLNPGGNWDLKRWSPDNFALLAKKLSLDFGLKIVFPGSAKDKALVEQIIQRTHINAVNLAGETSVGESLALYKRSAAVICGDSGPLHLAHSVGADVIGIYGPTSVPITGPRGIGRSQVLFNDVGCNKAPCYHLACTNNVCMQSVTVDDVLEAFKKLRS